MKTSDFDFDLPSGLIAYHPSSIRGQDRLMLINRSKLSITHHQFTDIIKLLSNNALVVFNNSKVRKARLFATKSSGGTVEVLLIKPLESQCWLCILSKAKRQPIGTPLFFSKGLEAKVVKEQENGLKILQFNNLTNEYLDKYGHMPLPPYIKREDIIEDSTRYQTIYAKELGSAAAPTAGLHFTQDIMNKMLDKGIEVAFITLHVGLGTFEPLRSTELESHMMHSEYYQITDETAIQINRAMTEKRPIIAIGTTSCRVLESANNKGVIAAGEGNTNIFIYPGYQFKTITGLLTNFHTPKSTLLALVSALASKNLIDVSYQEAIKEKYRFFSYGDAMLII